MQLNRTSPPGDGLPDETIVKAFQDGDREAFAALYLRYFDQVSGYVRKRRTRVSAAECEDLVQEIFTDALAELDDWRDDGRANSFRRWLFGRVAHFALYKDGREYWVRRQAYFRSEDAFRQEMRDNPDQAAPPAAVAAGLGEALRGKLGTLRSHYRQVLELHYVEGLSIDQTAEVMDRTPSSVNNLAAAALAELRAPKQVKHDRTDKVTRIVAAARRVLAEYGEDGFTVRAVAEVAEVSPALAQHYFGSRAALLAAAQGDPAALEALRAPKRVTYDRGDKVARILTAARQVLAERGEDGFSLRAVAEVAGVSNALPAHYFGSRAGLLSAARNGDQAAPAEGHRPVPGRRAGGPRSAAIGCRSTDGGAALAGAMGGAR
ncbi:sigma-70 family RNA polymerase sigma factor [Actinomadura madurae]|uniref:sigma-70 family RNA polymerase sigma factor n=1 Tax=Actinomadura madurae TaxID=1993 RepID=UPI00399BE87F